VLAAATELFASRGFHGTSMRDIAARAGANVAAGHYHYGSKRALYLEVLREQFAQVRTSLDRHGASPSARALDRASRSELVALLEARVRAMFDILVGPPPQPHGALLLREMSDPTDALPIIVEEFIRPQEHQMEAIVARLMPRASRATIQRVVFSIVGQILFYRYNQPLLLELLGLEAYPPGFTRRAIRHVTEFSLGGLARVNGRHAQRRPRAGMPPAPAMRPRVSPTRRQRRGHAR
jgi:AcrR family transcriptional regulator